MADVDVLPRLSVLGWLWYFETLAAAGELGSDRSFDGPSSESGELGN